jgi:hypothetical protein
MTSTNTNKNCMELSHDAEAAKISSVDASESARLETAGTIQKNEKRRESFLGALLRVFSSVAF